MTSRELINELTLKISKYGLVYEVDASSFDEPSVADLLKESALNWLFLPSIKDGHSVDSVSCSYLKTDIDYN